MPGQARRNESTLRVALGSPVERFGSIWRFWTHRSDLYISTRRMARLIKISVHESGVWTFAATSESGATFGGNRRGKTWHRPAEFQPGWTMGPTVCIARFYEDFIAPDPREDTKAVTWLGIPPVRHAAFISVFLASDPAARPAAVISPSRSKTLASMELENGETAWIVARQRKLRPEEHGILREVEKAILTVDGDPKSIREASLIWSTTSPAGPALIAEIPLPPKNVVKKGVS